MNESVTFDGSFEGFLCVVYAVYYEKLAPLVIQIAGQEQLTLCDTPPVDIKTDDSRASRVYNAICEKIARDAGQRVYYAFLADDEGRLLAILQYIKLGFLVGGAVDSHLHEDFVARVHRLAKYVWREAHLLHGFCRFESVLLNSGNAEKPSESEVLYAPVTPKNDVLVLLAQHFCERLKHRAWVIHDKSRNKAAVYDGHTYTIVTVPAGEANIVHTSDEAQTRELWTAFFNAIAISERKNPRLQRQMLPLYFRGNMTEFR
ncbi:MAG: TIGR03915 family putative DNA repair protein [Defluviitaleaceae bacterium]|nr:TIGR03915 family putative DNA repair protein [Defluviitaleaceae bacterium]